MRMAGRIVFTVTLGELAEVPGTPFAYWAPKSLRDLFQKYPPLDRDVARMPDKPKIADVKVGLQTSDDLRFTRYWWEVPVEQIATSREETLQGKKWVPFAKGGKPFFHDIQLVVNWENDGKEIKTWINPRTGRPYSNVWMLRRTAERFFFREGLAWADIVSEQRFDMRRLPPGCIFAVGAHAIFTNDEETLWKMLAFGNSLLAWMVFRLIEPIAHHKHIGYVSKLPIAPSVLDSPTLAILSLEAHDRLREWATGDETATVFVAPWITQIWDAGRGSWDEKTALPKTGHPLARDFEWLYGIPQAALEYATKTLQNGFSLYALAQACVIWESELRKRIDEIQRQIDDEVYRLYEISDEDRELIEAELTRPVETDEEEEEGEVTDEPTEDETFAEQVETAMSAEEHIKRLVHYLAHEVIKEDQDGIVPLFDTYTADGSLERGLARRVREKLSAIFGEDAMPTVELELRQALGTTLDNWLATEFFGYHVGLYRLRPIIWQIVSSQRGQPAFSCFVYWHKLNADTLLRIQQVYLHQVVESARIEAERLANQLTEQKLAGAPMKVQQQTEKAQRQAQERYNELRRLSEQIQRLLQPHELKVQSRSAWVVEKVNEIVANGYRPNRDYGVRVNIEPLKQAGILPKDAERVKG